MGAQTIGEPGTSFRLSPLTVRAWHYNFGFENVAVKQTRDGWWLPDRWDAVFTGDVQIAQPVGWSQLGNVSATIDSVEKRSGRYSAMIERTDNEGIGGAIFYVIPANFSGKNIEVKAWLKGEGIANTVGLMLLFDDESNLTAVDAVKRKNLSAPDDWTEFSLTSKLPEDIETIRIGAIISGTGKLWIDDFRVLIDGRDISSLTYSDFRYRALDDNEFDEGSYINFAALTPQMVENLALLAKVWGFLKYYHPTVASGEYNWDYVLFRAMASMLTVKNHHERNFLLYRLAEGLGDFNTVRRLNIPNSKSMKMLPDWHWIDDSETLGDELSRKLNAVKMARRENQHYYIGFHSRSHDSPKFRRENDYPHISPNDDGYRMLGLFRFWNMVQYFYPYRYQLQNEWYDTLIEFIPKVAQADSSNYLQVFANLVAKLNNPQTHIVSAFPNFGNNAPPLRIRYVEDKPVVVSNFSVEGNHVELLPGDVITKINQKPVDEITKQIKVKLEMSRFVSPNGINHFIMNNLLLTHDENMQIEYLRDGGVFIANLRCFPPETLHSYRINAVPVGHDLLTDEVGYFYPGIFDVAMMNEAMFKFRNTKGIIVDLRNPSLTYNWAYVLARYINSAPVDFAKNTRVDLQIPGLFTYSAPQRIGARNRRPYRGKVVVLVDNTTNRYGELTAMAFRALPNTVIIGSATGGGDGRLLSNTVSGFQLPGNIFGQISTQGIYYPDGKGITNVGIVPDIEVKPTIKGISEGKDELIEKAKQIIIYDKYDQ